MIGGEQTVQLKRQCLNTEQNNEAMKFAFTDNVRPGVFTSLAKWSTR